MNIGEVRNIAKSRDIKPGNLSKADLIRLIQVNEGNFGCYATSQNGECNQTSCLWREDCLEAS